MTAERMETGQRESQGPLQVELETQPHETADEVGGHLTVHLGAI